MNTRYVLSTGTAWPAPLRKGQAALRTLEAETTKLVASQRRLTQLLEKRLDRLEARREIGTRLLNAARRLTPWPVF